MRPLQFGVNLNNREPLIAPDYDLKMLLDLSSVVEDYGFDSVWVGDSLFSKPRWEPISLLSAISQRTSRVKLGTACMVSSTRNPLYLALEWATLDAISGGRTILGTGMGNPEEGVRREFDTMLRHQAERILGDLDVVKREEFEAVKEMARLAREENEALKARIAALEARLEPKPAETKFADAGLPPNLSQS